MKIAELSTYLRDQSARYGGIKDFLAAAGQLDKAASNFMKRQDMETMAALNGAMAVAWRRYSTAHAGVEKGPVAK